MLWVHKNASDNERVPLTTQNICENWWVGKNSQFYQDLGVYNRKILFLFLNQNICCGFSKEPSQWDGSFEHPKHMLTIMGKKIFTILRWNFLFIQFCVYSQNFCLSRPFSNPSIKHIPGRVAQSVTCLATDACLTADPGVASSIPVRSHTFVEIDHEIISTVILLRWFIQEGLLSVTSESMCTNYWLTACSSLPRKKCG